MNTKSSIISMGLGFSNQDNPGTGFLLSIDEVELMKNMAKSLKFPEDRDFLNRIANKEFITADEKVHMQQIFTKVTKRIKEEVSLSV